MSLINFESAREKERIRQELREVRAEILRREEEKAKEREERQKKDKLESQWMLPSISKKIDKMSSSAEPKTKKKKSKAKKSKKQKKEKKTKKKKRKRSSSSSDDSSSEEERIRKKKKKTNFSESSESSTDSSADDAWVEKGTSTITNISVEKTNEPQKPLVRNDWLGGLMLPTFTKNEINPGPKKDEKRGLDAYDPAKSALELNPHWKTGSGGLPTFQKPKDDFSNRRSRPSSSAWRNEGGTSSWRKQDQNRHSGSWKSDSKSRKSISSSRSRSRSRTRRSRRSSSYSTASSRSRSRSKSPRREEASESNISGSNILTDQELSDLAASQVKAEISGNAKLAEELQLKLDRVRQARKQHLDEQKRENEEALLTTTNNKGISRPFQSSDSDLWGGRAGRKAKKQKVETHVDGERVRYFADDDNYNLKQMFEKEKFSSAVDQDIEFATIAGQHKNPNDDLEDLFSEKCSKRSADATSDQKERQRAIHEHQQLTKTLDECDKCIASEKMKKNLIVAMGTHVYVSLPWHEGLQIGHCVITPLSHVSCSTQLDEDVWSEMVDFMKALNRMFTEQKKDVIFFETARHLNKRPHMEIHCIPSKNFELAPFYFKKAILESEEEWSTNKQLIDLKGRDVRRAIPKGLPYFWVRFGMADGFAHVIEDQNSFPWYFAQEVIGGLLEMEPKLWKKPWKLQNAKPKVHQFANWWKPYDITQ